MTFKEKVNALNEEYFDLYRNGDYYIKHTHNVVGETLYIVYRDNSPRNFKMNVDINKCIKYIEAHTPGATKASV